MSLTAANAAQSAFYADNPRDDARPDVDDLTPAELAEQVLHNHGIHNDAWTRSIAQVRELLIEAVELARSA